ncbi:glycoside hydrolase family 38 N-terminal domain-containing protein [Thermotoga profunda]|uniref:glycoside hydrolase family 38 N-terminal domain-containing protein n=1 Tax=Thermotoga profunda TaxID=1508420 RepID=UPI000597548C|nr:hypothetical protein [Thermotoga profunda]
MNCVICHTHWDREWFAPSSLTNEWLEELFQKLFDLIEKNKRYTYVLDGQTLILEDLINKSPQLKPKLKEFVRSGNLLIGPLYSQIDFRISPESAILKNLQIGRKDMKEFGANTKVAWMVDNFGFISQLPQLLKRYGIDGAFIWRGVGVEKPSIELFWSSPDGSKVKCIFLIGGYRNLYGLSLTKDLAKKRLWHEVKKLKPFSLTGLIPLLDGYDLDTNPEDPMKVLGEEIILTTPDDFLKDIFSKPVHFPIVNGEMISGKYACVFPGTLSTRVYLKRQSYVVGKILRYVEFLSFLNGGSIEDWYRTYLKTLIHDNICGVGIDRIHRQMQRDYKKMYLKLKTLFVDELTKALKKTELKSGRYVLSFLPFDYDHWHCDGKKCYRLKSNGVGFFELFDVDRPIKDQTLSFENDYYRAEFCEDGTLRVNDMLTGILNLEKELGDSYSTSTEKLDFSTHLLRIEVERAGKKHKIIRLQRIIRAKNILIKIQEKVIFDQSPLVKWQMITDLNGKNYVLSFVTKTFDTDSKVLVKMPFEIVERKRIDEDLLDLDAGHELNSVLLAAREVEPVRKFPFQGFVALSNDRTKAVMAKGVYQYEVDECGDIKIDLVRSMEWIAKGDVKGRSGDAGPLMYVPDAKCEGRMNFELAICDVSLHAKSKEFFKWFSLFDDPPMTISLRNEEGELRSLNLYTSELPWVCTEENRLVVYNPYSELVNDLKPGQISSILVDSKLKHIDQNVSLKIYDFPAFPSSVSKVTTSQRILNLIRKRIIEITKQVYLLENRLKKAKKNSSEYHLLKHKILSKKRTQLELKISLTLNKGKMPKNLMKKLNQVRAKRRIYDYIVELLKEE